MGNVNGEKFRISYININHLVQLCDAPPVARPPTPLMPTDSHDTILRPTPPSTGTHTNTMFAECFSVTGKIFTDQTGRFPPTSTAGNNDMLVMYNFDSNYVHVKAMLSKTGYQQILLAYKCAHKILSARGLYPRLQRLDN